LVRAAEIEARRHFQSNENQAGGEEAEEKSFPHSMDPDQ
jgi:hypothetical protein